MPDIILGVDDQTGRPGRDSPGPGEVFVVFDGRRTPVVLEPGQRLSQAEIRNWSTRKLVRVCVREFPHHLQSTVVAQDGFSRFAIDFTMTWSVHDAAEAAKRGDVDVDRMLETQLAELLSELDRKYTMDQAGADLLRDAIRAKLNLAEIEFIQLRQVSGRVDLDKRAVEHLAQVAQIEARRRVGEHQRQLESDALQASAAVDAEQQRARRERELEDARLEAERQKLMNQVEELKGDLKRTQARLDAQLELDLLERRLAVYGAVTGDLAGMIKLQIANDPTQVEVVIRNLQNNQIQSAKLQLDAVRALVEADAVEGSQLEEVARRALNKFLELASGSVSPLQSAGLPPPSPAGEVTAEPQTAAAPGEPS